MIAHLLLLAQQAPTTGFNPSFFIMMGLIFVVFYFFIIRPQRKREETRKQMIEAIKKGDRVVTVGGIHGTVLKVDDGSYLVEVDQMVKLRFDKNAIASVGAKDKEG
ncbi:MAG: preprotein translocase subunit YajC [Rhodothermaceae bacterium]|nr:preprotein translocase subunit YajC [Rhodothermaceae bacterium]